MEKLTLKKGITVPIPIKPTDAKYLFVQSMANSLAELKVEFHLSDTTKISFDLLPNQTNQYNITKVANNVDVFFKSPVNDVELQYEFLGELVEGIFTAVV